MNKKKKEIALSSLAAILFFITLFLPSISQPLSYHDFADKETLLQIPNAFDVLSNIAILISGLLGLFFLASIKLPKTSVEEKILWYIFFLSTSLTGILSFYYHLNPNNFRLAIERLGLAFVVPSFLLIIIMERIGKKVGLILTPFLFSFSILSVIYWGIFDDLRWYGLVQLGSVVFILLIFFLYHSNLPGKKFLVLALVFYVLARVGEVSDKIIYDMLNKTVSGHTLKHLFSALGAISLIGYLNARRFKSVFWEK